MKVKPISVVTLALLSVALLTSCSSTSQTPPPVGSARISYTKGVPGGVIFQTIQTTATVTATDHAKRNATLLGADGKEFTVRVGPQATTFDQLRVGDRVTATLTEKMLASLKEGAASDDGTAVITVRTATVIALDAGKHAATMHFDEGPTATLPIRDDVDPSRVKVGERVVFRVTEITVIGFERLP